MPRPSQLRGRLSSQADTLGATSARWVKPQQSGPRALSGLVPMGSRMTLEATTPGAWQPVPWSLHLKAPSFLGEDLIPQLPREDPWQIIF